MKKFGIKEVVATGIGTALFIVLTEVQIPLGIIPNTLTAKSSSPCIFSSSIWTSCWWHCRYSWSCTWRCYVLW